MPFHIRDPETDALVRELARRRGVGLTEAVREAVRKELRKDDEPPLVDSIARLRREVMANADPDFRPDKAFYDWLSDEEA